MTREAIEIIKGMQTDNFNHEPEEIIEALDMAIEALKKINEIESIISIDNSIIQEDVLKYKMICEVIKYEGYN